MRLAHAAAHLADRNILALGHPALQVVQDFTDALGAVGQQFAGQHRHRCPGHQTLDRVEMVVHTGRQTQVGGHPLVQDRDPAQRQAQLIRAAQHQVRHDLVIVQVEVGLIEAVEQHQGIRARVGQPLGHIAHRAEVRAELDRHRNGDRAFDMKERVDVAPLDLLGADLRIGRDVVDVQLERVCAGLLDAPGVIDPGPVRHAIQAGDDGNMGGFLGLVNELQVVIGAGVIRPHLREVGRRFIEALGPVAHEVIERVAFLLDLFLEQGGQDDGRRAGILEPLDPIQIARQRRSRRHQRVGQLQAHVGG